MGAVARLLAEIARKSFEKDDYNSPMVCLPEEGTGVLVVWEGQIYPRNRISLVSPGPSHVEVHTKK